MEDSFRLFVLLALTIVRGICLVGVCRLILGLMIGEYLELNLELTFCFAFNV